MALAPLERFSGSPAYAPAERIRPERLQPDRASAAVAPVERSPVDPRPVAPVEQRPVTERAGLENLAASARAAVVALAAVPREASPAEQAEAADDAQSAALAAISDPLSRPSAREVAQNFAAVAALVPSPQELANNLSPAEEQARIEALAADGPVRADAGIAGRSEDLPGARLSRFA